MISKPGEETVAAPTAESVSTEAVYDVLFVDDEQHILKTLGRIFRSEANIRTHFAGSPMEALEILAKQNIAVIVSDHRMPMMTGAEFLARLKEKRPSTIRIMLTGQADLTAVAHAVNSGEIFRFLTKPWQDEELRQAVAQAIQFYSTTGENRRLTELTQKQNTELTKLNDELEEQIELRTRQLADALYTARALNTQLEESLYVSTKAMVSIIELSRPDIGSHCRRVAEHAIAIGRVMGLTESALRDLEIAALLHDGGKLRLPAYLADKSVYDYSREELELYQTHPHLGAEFMKGIPYFESMCNAILSHHEHWDGTGFPTGSKGFAAPIESYIIGIADVYDHLMNQPTKSEEYLYQYSSQTIAEYSDSWFPSKLVQVTLSHIESLHLNSASEDVSKVGLADLAPQSILARDLFTMTGVLLASAGSCLSAQNIARIRSVARLDSIAGSIYVKRRAKRDQSK